MEKIVYYSDELNDEFSGDDITPRVIDDNYKYYFKNPLRKLTHIFWYRIIANPIAHLYLFFKFRHKIRNKKCMKKIKGSYFIYGNHTHHIIDAVMPTMISGFKDAYIITNANNVSIPHIGLVARSLGAIPLPDTNGALRNFTKCIKYHVEKKHAIAIYPEAHIWPYSTYIRNFKDASFRYPIEYNKPVFSSTTIYHKKKNKIISETYIDGPFYPDMNLPKKDARKKLRDDVYNAMVDRSKLNTVEIIKYIKKD